jgi:hypothetical protein
LDNLLNYLFNKFLSLFILLILKANKKKKRKKN